MTGRAVLIVGFGLGLMLAFSQACVTKFECIYIYVNRPKLCAPLSPVPTVDGGGMIAYPNGDPPTGCTCLPYALGLVLNTDPASPELDGLYEAIELDARATCVQLAADAGQDPSPCQSAMLDRSNASRTEDHFDSCKELIATIDEDRDGVCDSLEPGDTGTTESSGETGEDGGIVPDLGIGLP